MTFEELKRVLSRYIELSENILHTQKELEHAKELAATCRNISSVIIDGMPRGNRLSDSTYVKAQKAAEVYDRRINELLDEMIKLEETQQTVMGLLKLLSPNELKIITERYLNGTKWDYVPGKIYVSRSACFRLHDRAIKKMLGSL